MIKNENLKNSVALLLLGVIFLITSYLVKENLDFLKLLMSGYPSALGMFIYIFLGFLATVAAPLTAMPLIPLASNLWGWQVAAMLNIIGWGAGSFAAFYIANRFGRPLVKKFISLEKVDKLEKRMPKDNIFWTIVFLRIIIPVDILSYALGIFTKTNYKIYISATVLGITPFSIFFSYAGTMNLKTQMAIFIVIFIILSSVFLLSHQTTSNESH